LRILALDVGQARIGVALSDPTGTLATPIAAIPRRDEPHDVREVLGLATEHEVGEIVVGLPLSLSGKRGAQARTTVRFAEALAREATVPVTPVDERYSTAEAERLLRASGVEPSRDRARLDAAAAAVILQSYLDSKRASRDR
jgi:putative Holliday junction resolvase